MCVFVLFSRVVGCIIIIRTGYLECTCCYKMCHLVLWLHFVQYFFVVILCFITVVWNGFLFIVSRLWCVLPPPPPTPYPSQIRFSSCVWNCVCLKCVWVCVCVGGGGLCSQQKSVCVCVCGGGGGGGICSWQNLQSHPSKWSKYLPPPPPTHTHTQFCLDVLQSLPGETTNHEFAIVDFLML